MASENLDSRKASKKLAEKPNSSTAGEGSGTSTFSESLKVAATSPSVPTVRTNSSCGSLLAGTVICKASGNPSSYIFPLDRVMPNRRRLLNSGLIHGPFV